MYSISSSLITTFKFTLIAHDIIYNFIASRHLRSSFQFRLLLFRQDSIIFGDVKFPHSRSRSRGNGIHGYNLRESCLLTYISTTTARILTLDSSKERSLNVRVPFVFKPSYCFVRSEVTAQNVIHVVKKNFHSPPTLYLSNYMSDFDV